MLVSPWSRQRDGRAAIAGPRAHAALRAGRPHGAGRLPGLQLLEPQLTGTVAHTIQASVRLSACQPICL